VLLRGKDRSFTAVYPGVPKLSLAMYPFSTSIDEHVPLDMGAGRIFSRDGPIVDFPRVGQKYFAGVPKVAKLHFHHSKKTFFAKYLMKNCQLSKS